MFAFERNTHIAPRYVLIEKEGYYSTLDKFDLEKYDTVELIQNNQSTFGIILYYSYRGGGEKCKKRTVGFATAELIIHKSFYSCNKHFQDYSGRHRPDVPAYIYIKPARIILLEKNIIERQEQYDKEFREKMMREFPIMGG